MNRILCLILVYATCFTVSGQTVKMFNYSIPEGLPSSEVYDVFQDSKGFMWFATDNGVVRFDGTEMKLYQSKEGLCDPVVFGFFEDEKGRIWFRSYSGCLTYYEDGNIHQYKYNDVIAKHAKSHKMQTIFIKGNDVYFSTDKVICSINESGLLKSEDVKMGYAHFKKINSKYYLQSLTRMHPSIDTVSIDGLQMAYPLDRLKSSSYYVNNIVWNNKFYFSLGVFLYTVKSNQLIKIKEFDKEVISLSMDCDNKLWVGMLNGGMVKLDLAKGTIVKYFEELNKLSVTKVHCSDEKGLWISTLEKGVFHVPNIDLICLPNVQETKINAIEIFKENVVIGYQNGSLEYIDTLLLTHKIVRTAMSVPVITFFKPEDNSLWISYHNNGMYSLVRPNVILKTSNKAFTAYSEVNGTIFALIGSRIYKIDKNSGEHKEIKVDENINRNIKAFNKYIFLSNRTGINVLDEKLERVKIPNHFPNVKVSHFATINDSILAISTLGNGLILLNTKTWKYSTFSMQNQLDIDQIHSLLIIKDRLFVGTPNGITAFYIQDLIKNTPKPICLNEQAGLIDNKIDFLLEVNNDVWTFSQKGISIIPISNIHYPKTNPKIYYKTIKVNDVPTDSISLQALSHKQNSIQIEFGFIAYNIRNNRSRYRIENTEQWNYTTNRSFQFLSLPPGDYTLEHEYMGSSGNWIKAKSLHFVINPPWWQRWDVRIVSILIVILLIVFYIRKQLEVIRQEKQYLNVIADQQQKLLQADTQNIEKERNRIAKDLHDSVGTNLSILKLMLEEAIHKNKIPDFTYVDTQLNQIIREIKDTIYNLTPSGLERYGLFNVLEEYVNKLNHAMSPLVIQLHVFGHDNFTVERGLLIFRILQELITNSIKHAACSTIIIHINVFDDYLSILYEDNGKGFSYKEVKHGHGLDGVASRVQLVGGKLKFESGSFGISYSIEIPKN